MEDVNLIAFNFGYGSFTNGPGISCWNFAKFCKNNFLIYTKLKSDVKNFNINSIKNFKTNNTSVLHWWSGLTDEFLSLALREKSNGKKIVIGPNLFDGTNPALEIEISRKLNPDLILTVNKEIKYNLKKYLNYRIEEFMTGPDYDLWCPKKNINNKVLWKGNPSHQSKDITLALEVSKKLVDKIDLMGYPSTYKYMDHVDPAASYAVYVITSLSETKSEAVLEQMAAGVPVVAHPKVYMMGSHYKTGIVVGRDAESISAAANKILDDKELRLDLSLGARQFVLDNFKKETLNEYYNWLINEC